MNFILSDSEKETLLNMITSKDLYYEVIKFLDDKLLFPFSDEEMAQIAEKAKIDAAANKGTSIGEMRDIITHLDK